MKPRPQRLAERRPLWARLGWLVLIWAGSVLALGAVGLIIRTWLNAA
jgi:hypothetical protein